FYSMAQGYISYLNEEKDYQKVVSLTERGLQNFPYSFVLMEAQGNAYNQIKEVSKAEKLFKQSLSHHTGNTSLRKHLYDITHRKDESDEVITADVYDYIKEHRNSSMKTDYGIIILLDECIVNVFPEGGQKYDFTYIYEVTSDTGVEYLKEYELGGYETTILKSEIIKPDGSIVPAERSYGNLVFTNLKPGDVILVKYQSFENSVGRFFKDITLTYPFRSSYPTELLRYGIIYPKGKTFQSEVVNGKINPTTKTIGNKNYTEWKVDKAEALPINEDFSPSLYDSAEILHISTINSWGDIANWYADLVQKNLEMDKVATDTFNQIFPDGTEKLSEVEKAKKIYAYIQDNITYSFLDFRQSGYIPQKPSKTITTKLGDCKDLSALFVALANHAGLNAELVLVLTNDNGTKSNPLPNIGFNHCIIKVELDKKEHFMELTDNYAPFNTMPPSLYKANALVVSFDRQKNINSELIAIPFENTTTNRVKQYSTIDLTQELKKTQNTLTFEGYAKSYYNGLFSPSTSEDVRVAEFEKLFNSRLNKVVKIKDVRLDENDKYSKSLTFSIDFDINERLQSIGKMRFMTIPSIVQPYTNGIVALEQRKFPIFYPFYENINHYYSETVLNIDPENKFVEVPESKKFTYKNHQYEIRYELLNNHSLKVVREVFIPFDNVEVNDYAAFKKYVEKIIEQEESVVAFE
ncbi:MAG TPA: transglutaminase domain-containing protein, partial [Flavobacterium sp.]|nr:transglutaminase domain-containing protein [Flavobacterium sp.]